MNCNIPDIISLSDFDGDFHAYENAIYQMFCEAFPDNSLSFRGTPINHKKVPIIKGKSGTFWHIVSEGIDEKNRTPDLRRCERIAWPFHVLNNCVDKCDNLLIWENKRKSGKRVLIYCANLRYLVVLAKRNGYYLFWTAYPVETQHREEALLKEHAAYHKAKAAQLNG